MKKTTALHAKGKKTTPPVLIQRNQNGWIVGPYIQDPSNTTTYDDTYAFNDIFDLYAYLGEYYGVNVREEEGPASPEEGIDKTPE